MKQVVWNILVGGTLLVLTACGEATPPPSPTPAPVVVETGGTALSLSGQGSAAAGDQLAVSSATSVAATGADDADTPTPDALAATNQADLVVFQPGETVVARGVVRVYPEADPRAQAMSEYAANATFVVIEPGADYAGYPVEVNEVRWYRVRAEDGLVGWVIADGLAPQDEP